MKSSSLDQEMQAAPPVDALAADTKNLFCGLRVA
jgi:hypothetical protein